MVKKILSIMVGIITFVLMPNNSVYSQPIIDGESIIVEGQGRGRTLAAAKINARRDAAQKALGFLLEGTSLLETLDSRGQNEQKLEEKILRITRAFIGIGEEELSRHEDEKRHIFSVTLRVRVSGAELLNGLMQRSPEKSSVDGASLVGEAIAREQWKKETADALTELLYAFPIADYVRVKVENIGDFDMPNETLRLKVNFRFDRERYFSEAVPAIISVLDYVAEARASGLPFLFPIENLNDGTVSVKPSEYAKTIGQYLKLTETQEANKVIKPSGYANIYVQTRDYYFNAYRVNTEAFRQLVQTIFASEDKWNFSCIRGKTELAINFVNENGRLVPSKPTGIKNLRNIMFFMSTHEPSMFSWSRNDVLSDEKNTALFIIPAFSFDDGQRRDYVLYQEENTVLPPLKVSAEDLLNLGTGSSAQCSVVINRPKIVR